MPASNPDVVIIGSGPGGGACALALARRGAQVIVLESGPRYNPSSDYGLSLPDWERRLFPERSSYRAKPTYAELQPLSSRWDHLRGWNRAIGRLIGRDRRYPGGYHHVRGVGGTTLHFAGEAHRLNPLAMQLQSQFGVGADWPISYADLEPHYVAAEKILGVAGPENDSSRPRSAGYPLPAHKLSYASGKVADGARQLGLGWQANSLAILSQPYDGRPNCNYCNNCCRGCPRSDKGTVDVTFLRKAVASGNCEIRSESTVINIEAGPDDRVVAAHYIDHAGKMHQVRAPIFVIACGAVETPRLLLNSHNRYAGEGIGNETGHVGRHFMETLSWASSGLHPENLGSYRGIPSDSICWDLNAPTGIPDHIGGCRFSTQVGETDLIGPISYAKRIVGGWGQRHKEQMREMFGHILSVGAIGESLPNDHTFIDLDPNQTDSVGQPLARINAFLSERDLERLSFMAKTCREILEASGVSQLVEEYGAYDTFSATHVFGTCRMGVNAHDSVVRPDCRTHRWRNLYVCDASVFPSSGGGESPSLTIEALGLRAGDLIADALTSRQ